MNCVTCIRTKFLGVALLSAQTLLGATAHGGQVDYGYDEAGRLNSTIYVDEKIRGYTLDAAGNRTTLQDVNAPAHPGAPSGPANNTTGSFAVTWTASSTAATTPSLFYKLYESHDANSSDEVFAKKVTSPSVQLDSRITGIYYYRVRACLGENLCGRAVGPGSPTIVLIPPGVPPSITLPPSPNTTGNYSISWTTPVSNGTPVSFYELFESTDNFATQTKVGSSSPTALTKKPSGDYYYRVRACNTTNGFTACSDYRTGAYAVHVARPPDPPGITVPAKSTGTIPISWTIPDGPVTTYLLYESVGNATSFPATNTVYQGSTNSTSLVRDDGQYYYRVRACNNNGCSDPSDIGGPVAVINPPPPPQTVSVPPTNNTGTYRVTWNTPNGGIWTGPELYYEIYEAGTDGVFGATAKYTGGNNYYDAINYPDGTYSYRVRSCNVSGCGNAYRDGDHSVQVILPPAAPASINVPATSSGTYNVSWASVSTATSYTLFQSSSSNFANQFVVYQGSGTTAPITNGSGTFYHRVQACKGTACSGYTAGSQGVVVALPPSAPTSISASTTQSSGDYIITWGASASGTVTKYELYESVSDPNFGNPIIVGNALVTSWSWTARSDGTYYYRVRACNGASCSGYTTLSSAVVVARPPGMPAWISFSPSQTSVTGNYTISWGAASSGTTTRYELREATSSGPWTVIYSGASNSFNVTNHASGHFLYQVAACNQFSCGQPQGNPAVDVSVITPPSSITVPSSNNTGSYTISWTLASGTVTRYELFEATNSSFSGETLAYSGTSIQPTLVGRTNNSYYYRVRACNDSGCSATTAAANPVVVSVPVAIPAVPTVTVPTQVFTTSPVTFTVRWTNSPGATYYELYETNTNVTTTRTLVFSGPDLQASRQRGRGSWRYEVRACNSSGCSDYSLPKTVNICGTNGC